MNARGKKIAELMTLDEVRNLLTILGAAEEMFAEQRDNPETKGIFKSMYQNWIDASVELRKLFAWEQ